MFGYSLLPRLHRCSAGAELFLPLHSNVPCADTLANPETSSLCDFFAFVPAGRKKSRTSCDFFVSVPSDGPRPPGNATAHSGDLHFPSPETCHLRHRSSSTRRHRTSGGTQARKREPEAAPAVTAGTKAKKSHGVRPQNGTAGTKAKKSHSNLARASRGGHPCPMRLATLPWPAGPRAAGHALSPFAVLDVEG